MRFRTKLVFCGLGALALGLGTIATIPASNTAVLVNYHDYAQTLPADVIGTLPPDQQQGWMNATRYGNVSGLPGTAVPSGSYSYSSGGSGVGLIGGVGQLLTVAGQLESADPGAGQSSSTPWWQVAGATKPAGVSQADWDQCKGGGVAGDFWNGVNDFFASLNGVFTSSGGTDCAKVRKSWQAPRDPKYVPTGAGGWSGYPMKLVAPYSGDTATIGQPYWSSAPFAFGGTTRQEGWVMPVALGSPTTEILADLGQSTPTGNNGLLAGSVPINPGSLANYGTSNPAACPPGFSCFVVDRYLAAAVKGSAAYVGTTYRAKAADTGNGSDISYGAFTSNNAWPYSDPSVGAAPPSPTTSGQVYMESTVTYADGTTASCKTGGFVETDPVVPQPCDPPTPPGEVPSKRLVELVPGSEPSYVPGSDPTRQISDTEIPDAVKNYQTAYPQCTGKVCTLDLLKTGVGSCLDHPGDCGGWYTDPSKTTDYTCTYDGTAVDLSQCVNYARLFEPDAVTSGTAYPSGSTDPSAPPTTSTSTAPGPTEAPGDAVQDPDSNRNCWANGWSWNPVDWVMTPVRCALEWAFVPRQSVMDTYLGNMRAVWSGSSLVSLLNVLQDAVGLTVNAGGCDGPEIHFAVYGASYDGHPLSACDAPMSNVASFSWWFTGALAWVLAIATIARSIAGVVAFKGIGGGGNE